jgi:transposase-like protein
MRDSTRARRQSRSPDARRHSAYRRATRWILGRKVLHRTTRYLNSFTEQSHRAVKQRYYPMLGFGSFESASRFCAAFNGLRQYFRVRRRGEGHVSLAEQRRPFLTRWRSLIAELTAAEGGRKRETLSWAPSVT